MTQRKEPVMNTDAVKVTTLGATAEDGTEFAAEATILSPTDTPGWAIRGPKITSDDGYTPFRWPYAAHADMDDAAVLLAECVAAYNRYQSAVTKAQTELVGRLADLYDHFRAKGSSASQRAGGGADD